LIVRSRKVVGGSTLRELKEKNAKVKGGGYNSAHCPFANRERRLREI